MKNPKSLSHLLALGLETGPAMFDEMDFSDIPDGDWRLGGYELLEEIGRGGMGIIYKARQPHSNRLVALKRLRPLEADEVEGPFTAARLYREAEAVASLDHPHILPIYEVGVGKDGAPFFSMKLAAGGSLAQVAKPIAKRQAAEWMLKVARAVQYAHGRGILHRDLKPANILLDGQGEPLVADFGLAKWLDRPSDLTQTLTVLGTPGYLAPEQAVGKKVGFQADIYSMGAILFELLSGRPPFTGSNAWSVVKEAAETPAPQLRDRVPGIDLDLETICSRCLEREVDARYRAAGDVGDDLQRWLDGRPIIARPVSLPERGLRWVRRNRVLAGMGLAAIVVSGLGIARERENIRLANEVHERVQASLAVSVFPILDLDEVSVTTPASTLASKAVGDAVENNGRLLKPMQQHGLWSRNFAEEARVLNVPYLLVGVTRKTPEGQRWALHYYDAKERAFTRRAMATGKPENAAQVLAQLTAQLLLGKPEVSLSAQTADAAQTQAEKDLLAKGEQYYQQFTASSLDYSIACLRKAVEINPRSVEGYSSLAVSLIFRSLFGQDDQNTSKRLARETIEKAIELNPLDARVYRAKAAIALVSGQYEEALEASRTHLELSMDIAVASGVIGTVEKRKGNPLPAMHWYQLGNLFYELPFFLSAQADIFTDLSLDDYANNTNQIFSDMFPDKSDGRLGRCLILLFRKDFVGAHHEVEKIKRDFPQDIYTPLMSGLEAFYSRDFAKAAEIYDQLLQENRNDGANFYGTVSPLAGKGFSLLQLGKKEEGKKLLDKAREYELQTLVTQKLQQDHLYSLAAIEAALGNATAATQLMENNLPILSTNIRYFEADPRFDSLRENPQFEKILLSMSRRVTLLRQQILEMNPQTKYKK